MKDVNRIIHSDALTELKKLEPETIDCCITSPPYYKARDYKVEGQIGQESSEEEYIDNLTRIFKEGVWRVLKPTGTCWVVIADTYNNKNLRMIPEQFALSMRSYGWILRNDIIFWKPNCMPSSAKDRFTIDYEHVYFFTKRKKYYFKTQYEPLNPDTLRESRYTINLTERKSQETRQGLNKWKPRKEYKENNIQNPIDIKRRITTGIYFGGNKAKGYDNPVYSGNEWVYNGNGRIKRTVWKIATQSYSGAHFATYPEKLVLQCLKAGCPEYGTVLDCFFGSGTTGLVALQQGRNFIGIELNQEYIDIAKKRLAPLLLQSKLN